MNNGIKEIASQAGADACGVANIGGFSAAPEGFRPADFLSDACPQLALDPTTIDQQKCHETCFSSTEAGGWLIKCNMCRVECPFADAGTLTDF